MATGHAEFAAFTSLFALLALLLAPVIDAIDARAKAERLEHPSLANARKRDAMMRKARRHDAKSEKALMLRLRFPWAAALGLFMVAGLLGGLLVAITGLLMMGFRLFVPDVAAAFLGVKLMACGLAVAFVFGAALREFDAWRQSDVKR